MLHVGDIIKVKESHYNCYGEIPKGAEVIILEGKPGVNYYTIEDIKTKIRIEGCILGR